MKEIGNALNALNALGGGLTKSLSDLADHFEEEANRASTSPQQGWSKAKHTMLASPPPYCLPPYALVKIGLGVDLMLYEREVERIYKRRTRAPELAKFLFRPFPPDISDNEITFVNSDPGTSANRLARKAVDVRIALEEQVDYPNNISPERLAFLTAAPEGTTDDAKPSLKDRIADVFEKSEERQRSTTTTRSIRSCSPGMTCSASCLAP